jgi:hypothetical protein
MHQTEKIKNLLRFLSRRPFERTSPISSLCVLRAFAREITGKPAPQALTKSSLPPLVFSLDFPYYKRTGIYGRTAINGYT